jgi:hypothetical protein
MGSRRTYRRRYQRSRARELRARELQECLDQLHQLQECLRQQHLIFKMLTARGDDIDARLQTREDFRSVLMEIRTLWVDY